jgi:hypothetical protein
MGFPELAVRVKVLSEPERSLNCKQEKQVSLALVWFGRVWGFATEAMIALT